MRYLFGPRFVMAPEGAAGAGGGDAGTPSSDGGDAGEGEGHEQEGGTPRTTPEPKAPPKKWKIKADNREEELDEPEMVRRAQLGTAAHKRMQKAAEIERREGERQTKLKTPAGLFELADEMGYSPEDLRSAMEDQYKKRFLDREGMTAEQKRIEELEAREAKREEETQKANEVETQRQRELVVSHHKKQLTIGIKSALEVGKLPATEKNVKLAAREVYLLRKAGLPVDPQTVANEVRRTLQEEHRAFYSDASIETLEEVLGEDGLKRFLKLSIEWHRKKSAAPATQPTGSDPQDAPASSPKSGEKKNSYIKMNEWQRRGRR